LLTFIFFPVKFHKEEENGGSKESAQIRRPGTPVIRQEGFFYEKQDEKDPDENSGEDRVKSLRVKEQTLLYIRQNTASGFQALFPVKQNPAVKSAPRAFFITPDTDFVLIKTGDVTAFPCTDNRGIFLHSQKPYQESGIISMNPGIMIHHYFSDYPDKALKRQAKN